MDSSSEEDPIIAVRCRKISAKKSIRRSRRLRTRYISHLDSEEDGTFLIPPPPRHLNSEYAQKRKKTAEDRRKSGKRRGRKEGDGKYIAKALRNLSRISYNEREMFSAEFGDPENLYVKDNISPRSSTHQNGHKHLVAGSVEPPSPFFSIADQVAGMDECITKHQLLIF